MREAVAPGGQELVGAVVGDGGAVRVGCAVGLAEITGEVTGVADLAAVGERDGLAVPLVCDADAEAGATADLPDPLPPRSGKPTKAPKRIDTATMTRAMPAMVRTGTPAPRSARGSVRAWPSFARSVPRT
jgi:hypothetical protein